MNKIILYIRRSENYYMGCNLDVAANNVITDGHVDAVQRAVNLWKTVTGHDLIETKKKIAEVAYAHNLKLKPEIIYNYSVDSCDFPPNYWIIPIDEDDLLDSKSITQIRKYTGDKDIIMWDGHMVNSFRTLINHNTHLPSNCYAIRASKQEEKDKFIHQHMYVKRYESISERLHLVSGLKITSPTSISSLQRISSERNLARLLKCFVILDDSSILPRFREPFREIQKILDFPELERFCPNMDFNKKLPFKMAEKQIDTF